MHKTKGHGPLGRNAHPKQNSATRAVARISRPARAIGDRWIACPRHLVLFDRRSELQHDRTDRPARRERLGFAGILGLISRHTGQCALFFERAAYWRGRSGAPFVFQGAIFTTTAYFDDTSSDLRLWQIHRPFPVYAQFYDRTDEKGRNLVVFGRGHSVGRKCGSRDSTTSEKIAVGASRLRGWEWGILDGLMRWGENQVSNVVNGDVLQGTTGPARVGELLAAAFDAGAGVNEAQLSVGDSGGGVFINDGAGWKLAGINYAADGTYSFGMADSRIRSGPLRPRRLVRGIRNQPGFDPGLAQATTGRLFRHARFGASELDESVISAPIVSGNLVLQSTISVSGPFSDEPAAVLDPVAGTFTLPAPSSARFYRVSATVQTRLTGMAWRGTSLVLSFTGAP